MNKREIEKAIYVMKNIKHLLVDVIGNKNNEKELDMAISALEHQLTNGWIPVSERLPDVHKRYLVSMKHKSLNDTFIDCRYYDPDYQFEYQDDFERYNWEVIAWQNLPKLYREIQESEGENE